MRSRQIWTQRLERCSSTTRARSIVAFLHRNAAEIYPPIRICRVSLRHLLECCRCRFQIALQEQSDAVIVPALPLVFSRPLPSEPQRRALRQHATSTESSAIATIGRSGTCFTLPETSAVSPSMRTCDRHRPALRLWPGWSLASLVRHKRSACSTTRTCDSTRAP